MSAKGLESLEVGGIMIRRTYALKKAKDKKFASWFYPNETLNNTIGKKRKFIVIHTRNKRFETSLIPYLSHLLNEEWKRNLKNAFWLEFYQLSGRDIQMWILAGNIQFSNFWFTY